MRSLAVAVVTAVAAMVLAGCGGSVPPMTDKGTTPSGVRYEDIRQGTGPAPALGETVVVNYTGWLIYGRQFDSSLDPGREPFEFAIGVGEVIKGWDEGIASMKVGGKRILTVPYYLAYGEQGAPPKIPPYSTLVFEVDLLEIRPLTDVTTPSGLKYADIRVGTGPPASPGSRVSVHYTGWLTDGTKFDSSLDPGREPLQFVLGEGQIIEGFEEGVSTMNIGGKRRLAIPPELAYGAEGSPPAIPPNATLIFVVELLDIW